MSKHQAATMAAAIGLLIGGVCGAQEVSSNWFRDPAVSPDGATIVFTHAGDLYSVPAAGGRAVSLTSTDAHEAAPVFSRDGEMIAFASDRFGNFDVFVMPASGGEARRLTFHSADDFPSDFSVDGEAVLFESARKDSVDSALFPSGVLSELYRVAVDGGAAEMVLTTPALGARYDASGERIVYEDRKGYEDPLRKHHTSSIARDIWLYDIDAGEHTRLTDFAGEDREPHFYRDGRSILFLSERAGDFNVFRMPLRPGAGAEQRTDFEHHPVRGLSVSSRGDAVFSWHGEIHFLPARGEARRVPIEIAVDIGEDVRTTQEGKGATEFSVAPGGKEIAFVVRGDVFVTSTDYGTTRRITDTPEQERSVDFAPDGRSLIYAGERDGSWNVYRSSIVDEDELYFFSATAIEEESVVATEADEFQPAHSPDGNKVAYLHERNEIRVLDLESGETSVALPGDKFYSYSDGDHWFDWSPDSRWLAVHFYSRGRVFFGSVGLVPASGGEAPIDLANSGYNDQRPHFAMKGGAIIWASNRYGERSHGSWGAEDDVIAAFLTQDAFDRHRLSKEEYELRKELEEKRKERRKDDEAEDDDASDEEEAADVDPIEIEPEGLDARRARLTIHSSDLADFAMTEEGDKLFYLARFEKGYDLWVHDFREESTSLLVKLGADSAAMEMSADGESIFLLADGALAKINASSGERKPIAFSARLDIDGHAERVHLFEHVWRQTKKKFYRPDMHGVDWSFYRDQYRPKLEGVHNNRDFAILLSEILGELNASHTGGRYRPSPDEGDVRTASLGVFFDGEFAGPGRRIAEIIVNGPLDRAEFDVEAGDVIAAVDGVALDESQNYYALLNGKAGVRVRLTIEDEGDRRDIVVKPISLGAESDLLYDRYVRSRREMVDRLSDGRLGYMHIRGMNDSAFRAFYSEVLGRHFDKEALVVDTRFNGGGWLHDDLATFLTGERYVDLYPRNDLAPDARYPGDPQKRWNKPSILVMSEGNYSDAHFFPWVYTQLDIGDTVGMPVPGTSTAVWWERLHTGDLIFGIPQVGTKGRDGEYLENNQLDPDHVVPLPPEDAASGQDTQIIAAVEILLDQLDSRDEE